MSGVTAAQGAAVVVHYAAQPMDCALHPTQPIMAAALVSGRLETHRFDTGAGEATPAYSLKAHAESARAARFAPDGALLVTASADRSILAVDTETGKPAARMKDAHEEGVNQLAFVSDTCLASGDDDGCIKLWDTRQKASTGGFHSHTDYITDFANHAPQRALLAVSGDGTLSVNDLRKLKVLARSEDDAEEELLSVAVLKRGRKVVAGASDGVLNIFSWGFWNGCSDRLPGHPASVDCMAVIDDSTVATGSSDGFVRLIGIQPHKMLGVLGGHGGGVGRPASEEGDPVEAIAHCPALQLLASAGHDDTVRIWNLASNSSGDEEATDADAGKGPETDANGAAEQTREAGPSPVAATASDAEDSDDSDAGPKKRRKKKAAKGAHRITKRGPTNASFFADL